MRARIFTWVHRSPLTAYRLPPQLLPIEGHDVGPRPLGLRPVVPLPSGLEEAVSGGRVDRPIESLAQLLHLGLGGGERLVDSGVVLAVDAEHRRLDPLEPLAGRGAIADHRRAELRVVRRVAKALAAAPAEADHA